MARKKIPENFEEVKQRIITASIEMIVSYGFSRFTLAGVAERIGLTKAAIYWYFSSKDELIQEITKTVRHSYIDYAREIADCSLGPYEKLKQILCNSEGKAGITLCILPIKIFLEYFSEDDQINQQIQQSYIEFIDIVATVLAEGIGAGVFRSDWNAQELAKFIVGALDGVALQTFMMATENSDFSNLIVIKFMESVLKKIE